MPKGKSVYPKKTGEDCPDCGNPLQQNQVEERSGYQWCSDCQCYPHHYQQRRQK